MEFNLQPSGKPPKRKIVFRPPPLPPAAPAVTPALDRGVIKTWGLAPSGQKSPVAPPKVVVTPPEPEKRNIANLRFACQEFVRFGRRIAQQPAEAAEILGDSWRKQGRFLGEIRDALEEILRRVEE